MIQDNPEDAARFRRRTWNRKKSHLPKHTSLPELQLLRKGRPQFHCRRCGFINTLIPLCLWCAWTSQEAEHEFELSMPRARRASAPARVFFHAELLASEPQYTHPHDRQQSVASSTTSVTPNPITNSPKKRRSPCFPEDALSAAKFVAPSITEDQIAISEVETMSDRAVDAHDDDVPDTPKRHMFLTTGQIKSESGCASTADPEASVSTSDNGVATATLLSLFRSSSEEGRRSEADSRFSTTNKNNSSKPVLPDPFLNSSPPLPSEGQLSLPPLSSVERSRSEPMTATRSSRMLKTSRRLLILDFHDTKTHPSVDERTDEQPSILSTSLNHDGTKPSSPIRSDLSPRHQQLRTLRRKKHLNIMQTSTPHASAAEPIAISLTVRSSTSKAALRSSQQHSLSQPSSPMRGNTHSHSHARTLSQPMSLGTESSDTPTTPPLTPTLLPTPPNMAPTGLSSSPTSSSPVRLGHPSRPYYSAIRKNGISPPSSRPSSIIGSPRRPPPASSSSRRQTYTPPSPGSMMSTPMSMTASRHLSLSAMFSSPAYGPSSPSGGLLSAFSVLDDNDSDLGDLDEGNADLPLLPPTPGPSAARFSFSLPRRKSGLQLHRLSHGNSPLTHTHTQSQSLSQAKTKGHRGSGVGFSISGETELRMALAAGAASAGIVESGFRFQETAVTSTTHNNGLSDNVGDVDARSGKGAMDTASQGNFMARVRKLRKGLKEMLLMTSTTTA